MIMPNAACPHNSVASHGIELADPSRQGWRLADERETGWCRDCSEYVQRELGALAWTFRSTYARGAWIWRFPGGGIKPS
jgi:hypothetical protein